MLNGPIIRARRNLDHLAPFAKHSRERLRDALGRSFAECPQGMNPADVGANHRLEVIKALPGLILPHGPIELDPSSDINPKNASHLTIPTELGVERLPVNCAHRRNNNMFDLAGSPAPDRANSAMMRPLLEFDDDILEHLMLGITYRPLGPKKEPNGMYFGVRLLGGVYDQDARLFSVLGDANWLILQWEAPLGGIEPWNGPQPAGPTPPLSPRSGRHPH